MDEHLIVRDDFPTSRKGFDPAAVRAHLDEVAQVVAQARREATSETASAGVREIIAAAERLAGELDSEARSTLDAAQGEAAATLTAAREKVEAALNAAEAEADETVSAAHEEARSALAEARGEAESIVEATQAEAQSAIEEANAQRDEAESKAGTARAEADSIIAEAREQADSIQAEARERAEELNQTQERAESILAEVQERAESILAEAREQADELTERSREDSELTIAQAEARREELMAQAAVEARGQVEEAENAIADLVSHANELGRRVGRFGEELTSGLGISASTPPGRQLSVGDFTDEPAVLDAGPDGGDLVSTRRFAHPSAGRGAAPTAYVEEARMIASSMALQGHSEAVIAERIESEFGPIDDLGELLRTVHARISG